MTSVSNIKIRRRKSPYWISEFRVVRLNLVKYTIFQNIKMVSCAACGYSQTPKNKNLGIEFYRGSLEQINDMLHLAKFSEDDIKPISQTISFTSNSLYNNDYILLQLDSGLEKEIAEGNTLYIKGNDDEDVVICTDNKTYNITEAETSNSLLLVDKLKINNEIGNAESRGFHKVEVNNIFYKYLEPVIGKPNLKKLDLILEDSVYKGPEYEYKVNNHTFYTSEELENIIQASNKELHEALDSMNVIKLDNKIRILDFDYHFRVLSYMLKLIDENSWEFDQIDFDETLEALKDLVPREVISKLFEKYTKESKIIDGVQLYSYKEEAVCKFFAEVLLHEAGRFNYNEFMQAWKESVPEGMVPKEEMLYGLAIIDRKCRPNVIWSLNEKTLPEKVLHRFNVLFAAKEKWTVPEIAPYIKRLTTEKLDVNAILSKYARAFKIDGVKYFSSKHGK